jgi:hypothetical protein
MFKLENLTILWVSGRQALEVTRPCNVVSDPPTCHKKSIGKLRRSKSMFGKGES